MKKNFLKTKIKNKRTLVPYIRTRFPPEPNGQLHLGHIKSLLINYKIYYNYKHKKFNIRLDNTNPNNEKNKFMYQLKKDIFWIISKYNNKIYYTSNYFTLIYEFSKIILCNSNAYACGWNLEKNIKGNFYKSKCKNFYRHNTIKKNLNFLTFLQTNCYNNFTIKAKISEEAANMTLRDPIVYRFKKNKKKKWNLFPTYDFSHSISDAAEKITNSICTLEFEENKSMYKWCIKKTFFKLKPTQKEIGKLQFNHNIIGKKKITKLIKTLSIKNWSDSRLLTVRSLKRKITKEHINIYINNLSISKQQVHINNNLFETSIRKMIYLISANINLILNPVILIINNINCKNIYVHLNNKTKKLGYKKLNFSTTLLIERKDINNTKDLLQQNKYIELLNFCIIKLLYKKSNIFQLVKLISHKIQQQNHKNIKRTNDIIVQWINGSGLTYNSLKIKLFDKLLLNSLIQKKKEIKRNKKYKIKKKIKSQNIEKINLLHTKQTIFFQCNRIGLFYRNNKYNKFNRIFNLKIH